MRDREKFAEGLAEGMQRERVEAIQRMIRKGYSKDEIFDLGYTEEEYSEAENEITQVE